MKKTFNSYIVVIVFMLGFVVHIGLSTLESRTKGKYSSKKVLIVSAKKDFQDPVISKVITILKKEGCYILLNDISRLNSSLAQKFGAIVIINKTKANQKDNQIKVFLDEQQQKKIVLLNAEGEYWKSGKIDNTDKIASNIIEKIHIIFKSGK